MLTEEMIHSHRQEPLDHEHSHSDQVADVTIRAMDPGYIRILDSGERGLPIREPSDEVRPHLVIVFPVCERR